MFGRKNAALRLRLWEQYNQVQFSIQKFAVAALRNWCTAHDVKNPVQANVDTRVASLSESDIYYYFNDLFNNMRYHLFNEGAKMGGFKRPFSHNKMSFEHAK